MAHPALGARLTTHEPGNRGVAQEVGDPAQAQQAHRGVHETRHKRHLRREGRAHKVIAATSTRTTSCTQAQLPRYAAPKAARALFCPTLRSSALLAPGLALPQRQGERLASALPCSMPLATHPKLACRACLHCRLVVLVLQRRVGGLVGVFVHRVKQVAEACTAGRAWRDRAGHGGAVWRVQRQDASFTPLFPALAFPCCAWGYGVCRLPATSGPRAAA